MEQISYENLRTNSKHEFESLLKLSVLEFLDLELVMKPQSIL